MSSGFLSMFRLGQVECEGKEVFIRQGQRWSEGPTCSSLRSYNWLWSGYRLEYSTRWQRRRMCTCHLLWKLQNYNSMNYNICLLLNNHQQENFGSHKKKKIPYIQGQRRKPSKMVGGVKLSLESNPIPARDSEGSNKTLCIPGPRDPTDTVPDLCLSLLQRYGSAVACHRGRGSGCSSLGHIACA